MIVYHIKYARAKSIYICGEYPLYKGILSQNQFSSRGFSPLALARNSYEYPKSGAVNFAGTVKIVYGVDILLVLNSALTFVFESQ